MEAGKLCVPSLVPPDACLPCPQQIMKDKWINIGYEGEELKPYTEPEEDFGDTKRIGEGQGSGCLSPRGAVPQSQGWQPLPLLLTARVLLQLTTQPGRAAEECPSLLHIRAV